MLISKLSEPVISRHEKIMASDMRGSVKRRSMRRNGLGVFSPSELNIVVKCSPGSKRTPMDFRNCNLPYRLCKLTDRLLLEIALPIAVIERDVSN